MTETMSFEDPVNGCCIESVDVFDEFCRLEPHKHYKMAMPCKIDNCNKVFRYALSFEKHLKEKHLEENFYRCDHSECDFTTADKEKLRSHVIKHLVDRPYSCDTDGCGKTFKTIQHLKKHEAVHSSEEFECIYDKCQKTFKALKYMNRHIDAVHLKQNRCRFCEQVFDTYGKLSRHRKSVHRIGKQFICTIDNCNREYPTQDLFRRHGLRIHSEKTMLCTHEGCAFGTAHKSDFNKHLKTHSNDRPYVCDTDGCGKSYKTLCHLKAHRTTHNGRQFECDVDACSKRFKSQRNLNQHMERQHSKQSKEYVCEFPGCQYKAFYSQKFNYHKSTHSDDKFKCHHCQTMFTAKQNLIRHLVVHSQEDSSVDFKTMKIRRNKLAKSNAQ